MVERGLPRDADSNGSLETTFLLAMATPMIVLPIERLFKPTTAAGLAGDDRDLDPDLADDVARVLGDSRRFGDAPFVNAGHWSYVPGWPLFNLAAGLPEPLLARLDSSDAHTAAMHCSAPRILRDLRNALAHGGVAYLDAAGRQHDREAAMYAFAGLQIPKGRPRSLNVLRIRQDHFLAFLMAWADWLARTSLPSTLSKYPVAVAVKKAEEAARA